MPYFLQYMQAPPLPPKNSAVCTGATSPMASRVLNVGKTVVKFTYSGNPSAQVSIPGSPKQSIISEEL